MGGYSVMRRKPIKDSPFKQKDGSITIMVSFQDQDWHGEYKEIKHSNVAIRTKLKNETALKNPRPTIGIGMNKPVIKINLKDK